MSGATTEDQQRTNDLRAAFLDSHNKAKCPDAVALPYYFIESFDTADQGELLLHIDSTINNIIWDDGPYSSVTPLSRMALGVLDDLADDHPDLIRVIAATENGQRSSSVDLDDLKHERGPTGMLRD